MQRYANIRDAAGSRGGQWDPQAGNRGQGKHANPAGLIGRQETGQREVGERKV